MATPTPRRRVLSDPPPVAIDPRWLLKAAALVVAVALLCGYVTLCLLFFGGQWQLVLHPSRPSAAAAPLRGALLHFAPDASAAPQLTGWYIPADPGARYAQTTLLLLRRGDGSLSDDLPLLTALHDAGANLLAFDYRGYGPSLGQHPTQLTMQQDAESAFGYLTTQRHVAARNIVPYGSGLGASLATHLALDHGDIPALILDSPAGDTLPLALASPATQSLPVRLLFRERFPLAVPLHTLRTPKLLIARDAVEGSLSRNAADPKFTVALPPGSPASGFSLALTRFLDEYLPPSPVPRLEPSSPPTPAPLPLK